jgi:hypothetical protein
VPLGTNESFAIGMASNAERASGLTIEFRPNGVIVVESRDPTGQLANTEKLQLSRSQISALRARIAAFRPPPRNEEFLPRGCTYTYDASDTVTLGFENVAHDAKDADGIKFVHFQETCRSRWAELGLTEIRAIIASLPQTALIRSSAL